MSDSSIVLLVILLIALFVAWLFYDRRHHAMTRRKYFDVRLIESAKTDSPAPQRNWQLDLLTPREIEVAQLVAENKRNKEIAYALNITNDTVESHLKSIYKKLAIHSRIELKNIIANPDR